MELKDIIKKLKKYRIFVAVAALVGIILGYAYFLIPHTYTASGSFYINRAVQIQKENNGYFTYEGYYSQQTALSYTNTVVALLESYDVRSESLKNLNIQVNEASLRKYGRLIKVKKMGPQLVTLTTKQKTANEAEDLWKSVSKTLVEKTSNINERGDSNLNISAVIENPVIKESYKPLFVCVLTGAFLATFFAVIFVSIKEYFS